MRPLATNEELYLSLSKLAAASEMSSGLINLDPKTRSKIVIRPRTKVYAQNVKARALSHGQQQHKLACFTSVYADSDTSASNATTPSPTPPTALPRSLVAAKTPREAAAFPQRIPLSAAAKAVADPPNSSSMPRARTSRVIDDAFFSASKSKKKASASRVISGVLEGRIEKRRTLSKTSVFIPRSVEPIARQKAVAKPQAVAPIRAPIITEALAEEQPSPTLKSKPTKPIPPLKKSAPETCECIAVSGVECHFCRILRLQQSFSTIVVQYRDKWGAEAAPFIPA
ncbi:hypothetical protein DFP72DRAFT_35482 [Ephemerocybe angulata]|uniref:Uncharacterized protein n=1 Tax=Ephemerocybe angulata TaxID=980116 RepID=A0A8H6IB66_9AGAR|nr:hypothetical protein DFP72DRAFT_35482 [Tulosesus angulatus]